MQVHVSLPELGRAELRDVHALLALVTCDLISAGAELREHLRSIANRRAVDPMALWRAFEVMGEEAGEWGWYDGGWQESYERLRRVVETLCRIDRDGAVVATREIVDVLAGSLARELFYDAAHASGYFYDPVELEAMATAKAGEWIERRWQALRRAA
jgi:hypothetical protein